MNIRGGSIGTATYNDTSYMSGIAGTSYQTAGSVPGQSAYSVKYLGIVDGAMGILSRKMPLAE